MKKILLGLMLVVMASMVFAQPPQKVSAFVCPVITQQAVGDHNPQAAPLGATGTYTVGPPTNADGGNLMVPVHATNMNGAGVPGGPQSQPGDTDYTAIWSNEAP